MSRAPILHGVPFNHRPARRSSRPAAPLAIVLATALLAGCLREPPAHVAPVWAPDGRKLYYAVARPDGTLSIRRVDMASRRAGELAASRLAQPPVAMALSPQGDRVACAVLAKHQGGAPRLRLHLLAPGGAADRVVWQGAPAAERAELRWTPDGTRIVLAAQMPAGAALWLVAADGGAAQPLAPGFHGLRAPAISPDGARVAFVARATPDALWALHVVTIDRGTRRVVAHALFRRYGVGYAPAWSPSGDALAYVAERYATEGFAEIRAWHPATRRHTTLARTMAGGCIAPAWSPDGRHLAYARLPFGPGPDGSQRPGTGGRGADLMVVDAAGGTPRALVADGLVNLMPAWSPDGSMLAFNTRAEPGAAPHVTRIVDLETAKARLAEGTAAAGFALAMARHARGSATAFKQALEALGDIQEPEARAHAHLALASHYARQRLWGAVARHAEPAAADASAPTRRHALRLLATARAHLGDPKAAAAAADRLATHTRDQADRQWRDRLRRGLQAVAAARARWHAEPTAESLHRLADTYLIHLDQPAAALEHYFRLIDEFRSHPRLADAAASVFRCYATLGAHTASYRVLERAASLVGPSRLSRKHKLLLAESAAATARPEAAVQWLDRLEATEADPRATAARVRAAEQFHARGHTDQALAAWSHAAKAPPCPAQAKATVGAARLLIQAGRHVEAARHLAAPLAADTEVATLREALRLLAKARLQRAEPVAYGAARVGQLVAFAYYDSAARLGEQLLSGLPPDDPRRHDVRRPLAAAFDHLAAYHMARDNVARARAAVDRWLRWASPRDDLPAALAALAACQAASGQRRAHVHTLTRLTLEFPHTPQAAAARRRLHRLNTPPPP